MVANDTPPVHDDDSLDEPEWLVIQTALTRTVEDDPYSNEDFRLLVHRAIMADDARATDELVAYIGHKIRPKIMKVRPNDRDDVSQELTIKALQVARGSLLLPVVYHRNYTFKAVNNEYVRQIRRLIRDRRLMPIGVPEDVELHVAMNCRDAAFSTTLTMFDPRYTEGARIDFLRILEGLRREATSAIEKQLADTLTLMYAFGISISEAFELLNFTKRDRNNVTTSLRRWKVRPRSLLGALINYHEEA